MPALAKPGVDVKDVREMYSLMKYHHASAVKIVACGDYTADAWRFVVGKPFELIYGETLLAMLRDAQLPVRRQRRSLPRNPLRRPPMHHRPPKRGAYVMSNKKPRKCAAFYLRYIDRGNARCIQTNTKHHALCAYICCFGLTMSANKVSTAAADR